MEVSKINQEVSNLTDEWLFYLSPRFLTYRPKIQLFFETEKYILKSADSMNELVELFRLRHHIFLSDSQNDNILDVDKFDSECDHIIIKCKKTNEICGTYRIITANNHVGFYSETEFQLDKFVKTKTVKMELGRACIHQYHRNGHVIDLLWRGIGAYANKINAEVLFGCSSLPVFSSSKILSLKKYWEKNNLFSSEFNVEVNSKYHFELDSLNYCELFQDDELKKAIPPLLGSYLNAGAKIHGAPAFDKDFDCLDFLTILNLEELNSSYRKRYFKDEL